MVNVIAPKIYRLWCADTIALVAGHECWEVNWKSRTTLPTGVAGVGEFIEIHD